MPRVAIATVSQEAAEAGARIAREGGNAVDAAVAAGLLSTVTHPGMCSLGGGGYALIWPASGAPVAVDGGHEMPGRGLPRERFGDGGIEVHLEYGGGVDTIVGPGSVATPGLLAGLALAAERHGRLPWRLLVEPAWETAREGFPMPASCHAFLVHAHDSIYGHDPRSRAALHGDGGRLLEPGETIRVDGLAETLRTIADEGVELFYDGELGRRIADHVRENGGILTHEDLRSYRAVLREPLAVPLDGWRAATNPPPALGGAVLTAMLRLMDHRPRDGWSDGDLRHLVRVQEAVLGYRRRRLDASEDIAADATRLLEEAGRGDFARLRNASSTLHTSAVDSEGTACAITLSDGYGSGVVPPGTGIWLNNCLGERELNRGGYHVREPGTRLPSNMAPTVARRPDGALLAIGSPGADRITTAILQVLLDVVRLGTPPEAAVERPRLHVEEGPEGPRIACEPGLPSEALEGLGLPVRAFEGPSMFFGGVELALRSPAGEFETAADPRRIGGTAVGGTA